MQSAFTLKQITEVFIMFTPEIISSLISIVLAVVAAIVIFKIAKKVVKIVLSLLIIAAIAYAILGFTGIISFGGFAFLPFVSLI